MSRVRIGELLTRMGQLSAHDIQEVLEEQNSNHHRFGDIALTWGLCQPEHIWRAWTDQLGDESQRIDLQVIGIDTQATAAMPAVLARQFHAIPLRVFDDQLILATRAPVDADAATELSMRLSKTVRFVFADAKQIETAIKHYYPATSAPGNPAPIPLSA